MTHGEAYEAKPEYRAKIAAGQRATDQIRSEVARLVTTGLSGEQAWAKVLKQVSR